MYTGFHRPSKFIATTTRRGITQKVDTLDAPSNVSRETGKTGSVTVDMSAPNPKPVFHQVNGRRSQTQKNQQEITYSRDHIEIIRYIHGTWTSILNEYETSKHSSDGKVPKIVCYQDDSTNQHLKNFVPFDLETFWGQRILQRVKQDT